MNAAPKLLHAASPPNTRTHTLPATYIRHDIFTYDSHHTMSVEPGVPYSITNIQSGLALHLSEHDDKTIVARPRFSGTINPRQSWIPLRSTDGQWTFVSAKNGQSIGFEGGLWEGVNIITSDDASITKAWDIQSFGPFQCKISFLDTPHDTPFVMELRTPVPDSQVQLFIDSGRYGQFWRFTMAGF